jgi:hypothetical protein
MADNLTFTTASGNAAVATDDIGSVHYQRMKMTFGADGASADVSSANPIPVTIAATSSGIVADTEYEVFTSATQLVIGATGATGDLLSAVIVVPSSVSPGAVTIYDNLTAITIFAGGANSLSNLVPFTIDLGMRSVNGAWRITTGTGVSAICIGDFT